MKKASQILYTIGKVFNVIELIGFILALTAGILAVAFPELELSRMLADTVGMDMLRGAGVGMIATGAIGAIVSAIVLYFASRATASLSNDRTDTTPHVIMIVIGLFGVVFYLIGGIVALVAENARENAAG